MEEAKLNLGAAPAKAGSDKRRHKRVDLMVTVRYKVINRKLMRELVDSKPFLDDGRSVNISLSGISLTSGTPLNKGDFVKLELSLPGTDRITRALAEVMWSGPDGASGNFLSGIRFLIILNEADEHSIKRYLQEQARA